MITRSWPRSPVITTLFIVVTVLLNSLLIVCDNSEQGGIKEECDEKDPSCSTDKLSLEAINELHHMIDDDQDGNVNQQESKGFLKEELQYTGGSERVAIFHNNDSLISVDDLWKAWMKSDVYNWTVDDVVHWLESHVHLPQYSATFRAHNIIGRSMPRLAITKGTNTLKTELGIKNGIHRQKISVQAMDLVLFGPPKGHNVLKDIALILSTFFVVGVSWFAYSQNKRSKCQLERMLREMENLQKADDELKDVQNKLTEAEELQLTVVKEKTKLEMKYQDEIEMAKKEAERLKVAREGSIEEISRLKLAEEELVQVRGALKRAEKELERSQWVTPAALRNWLQLTYEIELDYFNRKKLAADIQFKRAREECERMSRKRVGIWGSLRVATSSSMDEMDHQIEEARSALEEVKHCLDERLQRWHNIEQICGFPVCTNPGKEKLVQMLQIGVPQNISVDLGFRNVEEGELDEDTPPGYPGTVFMQHTVTNGMVRPPPYPAVKCQPARTNTCNKKKLFRRWSETNMVAQPRYPVPGTSTPLRPHNLPNNLKNSMGQLGSSSSLPRSRTPKKRHSDESHQSDDLSSNSTETPPDTSLPDKPVFHLDNNSPSPESLIQQQHTPPSYQPMKVSQSMSLLGNSKHYSDTIGGLGYIKNQDILRQNVPFGKRSQSDANLEKLNNSAHLLTNHSVEEKTKPKEKKKNVFNKLFHKKHKS
ncbi:stromal interaction molecule 1-like isoform X2 [Mytilus galloprovincialis]|uniref:stromal interaction molecule 1-like isoform X2 n=1 Tax=Mytilus galloprovincialis TaxID=29158 RepID=UPI003F7CAAE8